MMTRQLLFRREVVEARQDGWMGTAILVAPRIGWVVAGIGCLAVVAIGLLAVFGHYTQHVTATGRLVPSRGLLTLTSAEAGELTSLRVQQGQSVHQGQVIATVSGELDSAAMGGTYASVSKQLRSEKDRLYSNLQSNKAAFDRQRQLLESRISSLSGQAEELDGRIALQRQQVEINRRLLDKMQSLSSKGYISTFQIVQQKGTLLDQQSQLNAFGVQALATRQQLKEARSDLAQLPLDAAAKGNAIRSKLADIEQTLAQNEARRAFVIRAPRDGVISAVMVEEGQPVKSGQPIMVELPAHSVLQARLFVPSRQVGFIHHGSAVLLRFQAFPYQDFGQARGTVRGISQSALSPEDVQRLTGKRSEEPQYQIEVALDNQTADGAAADKLLLPGMTVDASIRLRKRRLIEWFFEPLRDFRWRFR